MPDCPPPTTRPSGRAADGLRPIAIALAPTSGIAAVSIRQGETHLRCAALFAPKLPAFLRGQERPWISADYEMSAKAGRGQGSAFGRTQEIRRMVGRALRAACMPGMSGAFTITLRCEVLHADGGTRCAAITGGWTALAIALHRLQATNRTPPQPPLRQIAALSCGVIDGMCRLDLDYAEDSRADTDASLVLAADGGLIEVQASAEAAPFNENALMGMLHLARTGMPVMFAAQNAALTEAGVPIP